MATRLTIFMRSRNVSSSIVALCSTLVFLNGVRAYHAGVRTSIA